MNFQIGLSALRASQFAINGISHNLANATEEGYHRRDVILAAEVGVDSVGRPIGTGVRVNEHRRIRDMMIEAALTASTSDLSEVSQRRYWESQVEAIWSPGDGSLPQAMEKFFSGLVELASQPEAKPLREAVVADAQDLAARVRLQHQDLLAIQEDARQRLEQDVHSLNQQLEALSDLQNEIRSRVNRGFPPNDLLDQRDQLVNQIAELIDVQRHEYSQDQLGLTLAGSSVSIGQVPIRFEVQRSATGELAIQVEGTERSLNVSGGQLAGLLEVHNRLVPEYQQRLDQFVGELIAQVDQAHAQGIGLAGGFQQLSGVRYASDTTLPLAETAALPLEPGELYISIHDASGTTRTERISVDPAVDSLQDVAARISGLPHLQGIVDAQSGSLTIVADPGYSFDFTGALTNEPSLGLWTGTAQPIVAGQYTGAVNQDLRVVALSDGVIGETDGLSLQVLDASGGIVAELDVGQGYPPGSPLELPDGVSLRLGGGSMTAGDEFSIPLVGNADEPGLLSALGMGSLFTGHDAASIDVSQQVVHDPQRLATTRTGDIADTTNLEALIGIRDQLLFGDQSLTLEGHLQDTNATIGFQVQRSTLVEGGLQDLRNEYQAQRASISGVDVNEEMVSLTQYQKSYEAAIQVVRAMETMLDELFLMIG